MGKYEAIAHTIIDMVEQAIRRKYPFIDQIGSSCEGNTLLHGEVYYNLENEIVAVLRDNEEDTD